MPKKVLIITYYWPPAGGIVAQRWVKFSKYLSENNWEPIIYTVSNGNYPLIDFSKIKDVSPTILVIRRPIWEPHRLYQFLSRKKKNEGGRDDIKSKQTTSLIQKFSIWLRGNFFIPDARAMWIRPSIKFLSNYLKSNSVDAIVSTGPPHSMHMIALGLKKKLNIPWLADFRDPWTSMDYYKDLMLTKWADKKHRMFERDVLCTAEAVSVIGPAMKKEFENTREGIVNIVTNGFDEADFVVERKINSDTYFSIVHIGSLYQRRNPVALWKAMRELKDEKHPSFEALKIKLIGNVATEVIDNAKSLGLEDRLELRDHMPQREAIAQMMSARILLLPIDNFEGAQWVLTGKLFEYLAAQRPILCIGPTDGDAARVIQETNTGSTFDFNDVTGIKKYLIQAHQQFKKGELNLSGNFNQSYSHRHLTKEIAKILNRITEKDTATS